MLEMFAEMFKFLSIKLQLFLGFGFFGLELQANCSSKCMKYDFLGDNFVWKNCILCISSDFVFEKKCRQITIGLMLTQAFSTKKVS